MPIDVSKAVGAELRGTTFSWTDEDVILYNLGVGAGVPPTEPAELKYTYERELVALPTWGTIPPFSIMMSLGEVEGLDINLSQILHGDHVLSIHSAIPLSGTVRQTGRVVDVYDKGKGALVVIEVVSVLESSGEALFTNRSGVYVRGEGGFGGESGPSAANLAPERAPDHIVDSPTLPQQALLYRMASGDKNPLHADPGFAAFAGFERPILHGLCTYGIVAKAVVESALGGRPEEVATYSARFTGHVFPGETLLTKVWDDEGRYLIEVETKERATRVISNSALTKRS